MVLEHSFARIIDALGFNHLLQRGKEMVLSEYALIVAIYSLRRSLSILGFKTLLNRIKALKKKQIFGHLATWWSMSGETIQSKIIFTLILEGVLLRRKVV